MESSEKDANQLLQTFCVCWSKCNYYRNEEGNERMTGWEDEPTVAEMKAAGKRERGWHTESGGASELEVTGP